MNNRSRILSVESILYEHTDRKHGLTVWEIVEKLHLSKEDGPKKTILSDIDALKVHGVDIRRGPGPKEYHIATRIPDETEVSLLAETILVSKLYSRQETTEMIGKLMMRLSRYQRESVRRLLEISEFEGRVKSENFQVMQTVRTIHEAIRTNRCISFHYFGYGPNKETVFHNDGNCIVVSPYFTNINDEKNYLIAYNHKDRKKKYYRIDKIVDIEILNRKRKGEYQMRLEKASHYNSRHFEMFGGEDVRITLLCKNKAANIIIDKFTKSVTMVKRDEEHFIVSVIVTESPLFYGWLLSMSENIRLIWPEWVVENFKSYLEKVNHLYDMKSE